MAKLKEDNFFKGILDIAVNIWEIFATIRAKQ